jgi:phage/plasmid-associated DNA primase
MTMNEKYKPSYTARVNAFLFMGTNQPVKISDAKSGSSDV